MDKLIDLLQELGISKVKLAKFLGVSRQMVYNYLELDSIEEWPKEKRLLLLELLDIPEGNIDNIDKIVVDTNYLKSVESRINSAVRSSNEANNLLDLTGLSKNQKALLSDIVFLLKEKSLDAYDQEENDGTLKYLYNLLQSMENIPEIKYFLAYMAKSNGFIKHDEYLYSEKGQFIFEGILYTALTLYRTGSASKSKIIERHKLFVQDIETKQEEKLGRTQQLNTVKLQALRELGYDAIDTNNAAEVFEKIAEIESRKV